MDEPEELDGASPPSRPPGAGGTPSRSDEFLAQVGRLAGVGLWELDLATSTTYWSDQVCRIHGVPAGYQPTLEQALAFYPEAARDEVSRHVQDAIATGEQWRFELPLIRADGTQLWVRATGTAVFDEAGNAVKCVGAFQDISEEVAARRSLERLNQRLQLASKAGNVGVWELDVATNLVTWDARMFELYEVSPSATPTYSTWVARLHPDDRDRAEREVAKALAGEGDFWTEFRLRFDDGRVRYIRAGAVVSHDGEGRPLRMTGMNLDVTESQELQSQLSEQHALMQVTLNSIVDAVISSNLDGRVIMLNQAAERITGWSQEDAQGQPLAEVLQVRTQGDERLTFAALNSSTPPGSFTFPADAALINQRGRQIAVEGTAAAIRDRKGAAVGWVTVFHDASAKRTLTAKLRYRAEHDSLTGLLNRRAFHARLEAMLGNGEDRRDRGSLLYLDLDEFKLVNDSCGHLAGDQLLKEISKLIQQDLRDHDSVARLGGDEFAVLLANCQLEDAELIAGRICERIQTYRFLHEDRKLRVGASIGVVPVDNRWTGLESLIQAADACCRAAKEGGRNRVHVWRDMESESLLRKREVLWASRLQEALDSDAFVLYVQQIHCVRDDDHRCQRVHAEVLLRLHEADGTVVLPGAFLGAAERYHLAPRIDRHVLAKTIEWIACHGEAAGIETLSVNLSGQSVSDANFRRDALELLMRLGDDVREKLCLELTEQVAFSNLADVGQFVENLRAIGVRVALDDFGAGASFFGYLKSLAVDYLKIDGQFIRGLSGDSLDQVAVKSFVDAAKLLGLTTVAEFVEDDSILNTLDDLGVDFAQGFHMHMPEPIDSLLTAATGDGTTQDAGGLRQRDWREAIGAR